MRKAATDNHHGWWWRMSKGKQTDTERRHPWTLSLTRNVEQGQQGFREEDPKAPMEEKPWPFKGARYLWWYAKPRAYEGCMYRHKSLSTIPMHADWKVRTTLIKRDYSLISVIVTARRLCMEQCFEGCVSENIFLTSFCSLLGDNLKLRWTFPLVSPSLKSAHDSQEAFKSKRENKVGELQGEEEEITKISSPPHLSQSTVRSGWGCIVPTQYLFI